MPCARLRWGPRTGLLAALVAVAAVHDPASARESAPRPGASASGTDLSCARRLASLPDEPLRDCLRRIGAAKAFGAETRAQLAALLERSTGSTDHHVIAGVLDAVRAHAATAGDLAETLSELLGHQAAIYQDRDKWQVLRLRAYLFVTLGEIGLPDSALPMLVDALAYVDERMSAVEFGAAVRAVGTLGPRARRFAPYLLSTVGERFAEEEFSLDRYELEFPREEATTVQIEAMRALGAIGDRGDHEVMTVLRTVAANRGPISLDSRMVAAAGEALRRIEVRRHAPGSGGPTRAVTVPLVTPWIVPVRRQPLRNLDIPLTDHDERDHVLRDLVDRPVLLTFFYSRCQNAGKCSTTVSRLARLQRELAEGGIEGDVRLLAITFEPQFDTPMRIKRYAVTRGLELGDRALGVRLDPGQQSRLVEELRTPVGYNAGWVSSHGVEAVLLDAQGRLVRKYVNLAWDNDLVLTDFQRLLAGS